MKKLLTAILITLWSISLITSATTNYLHIIPETTSGTQKSAAQIVNDVAKWAGTVNKRYNKEAEEIAKSNDIWRAFETWVMNWDIILKYIVYIIRFINQLWILIWSIMILYAWYLYATSIFWWKASEGKNAIKNAIIWIIVIIFSYAIWKGLESMFL
jgi:hypothetical protein